MVRSRPRGPSICYNYSAKRMRSEEGRGAINICGLALVCVRAYQVIHLSIIRASRGDTRLCEIDRDSHIYAYIRARGSQRGVARGSVLTIRGIIDRLSRRVTIVGANKNHDQICSRSQIYLTMIN